MDGGKVLLYNRNAISEEMCRNILVIIDDGANVQKIKSKCFVTGARNVLSSGNVCR